MPPNRTTRPRQDKEEESLDLAESQLRAGGYARMSVAAIARELGIAANTIYWYFPSKDHLLVAVVHRLVHRALEAKPPPAAGLARQAIYFVDRLADMRPARIALHERVGQSELVAACDAEFRAGMRMMLTGGLRAMMPAPDAEAAASAFLATAEGVLALDLPKKQRDPILNLVLERLTSPG